MSAAARANIENWADRAQAAGWTLTIWTDAAGARNNEGFLQSTTGTGTAQHGKVKHLFAKDKGPIWQKNPLSKAQTLYEAALGLESFAMASDVARYALLHKHGGVYLDVDLGPGP